MCNIKCFPQVKNSGYLKQHLHNADQSRRNTVTVQNVPAYLIKPPLYGLNQPHYADHQHGYRCIKHKNRLLGNQKRRKSHIRHTPKTHHNRKQSKSSQTIITALAQQLIYGNSKKNKADKNCHHAQKKLWPILTQTIRRDTEFRSNQEFHFSVTKAFIDRNDIHTDFFACVLPIERDCIPVAADGFDK